MQTFNCSFSAVGPRGKKVERKFKIKALDSYQAMDIIVEEIGSAYAAMTNPVFRFGLPKSNMPRGLATIVAGAGPEEV